MTAAVTSGDVGTVRMLQLPVQLWAAAQEHSDELLREFALMTVGSAEHSPDAAPVPVRLLQLVDRLTRSYAGNADEQRERLFAAAVRGEQVVDELEYRLPVAVGAACAELAQLLDEADRYCREGAHLLTLATPDDVRLFRDWYLGEVQRQLDGAAPVPWPEFLSRAGSGPGQPAR